jgi:hypothetical protein
MSGSVQTRQRRWRHPFPGMLTYEQEIARLRNEIARLSAIVEAAQLTNRDVSLQRALIIQHQVALVDLQPNAPSRHPPRLRPPASPK